MIRNGQINDATGAYNNILKSSCVLQRERASKKREMKRAKYYSELAGWGWEMYKQDATLGAILRRKLVGR